VKSHLLERRVERSFNLSPWWGGSFEKLIKSAKRCLKKILGNASVTNEKLLTTSLEIEATLNSRPLSFVAVDDLEEPLTPSHLLHGRRISFIGDRVKEQEPEWLDGRSLTRRAVYLRMLMDHFWKRCRSEYLLELRNQDRHKAKDAGGGRTISVGDVVIVRDDTATRGQWNLGVVLELIPGQDGAVRGAVVRSVTAKRGRSTSIRLPVQSLYPLKCIAKNKNSHKETAVTASHKLT